jgi:hypothetical protein
MGQRRRKRARDAFEESQPFFGSKASFADAFPTVETLSMTVTEQDDHRVELSTRTYGLENVSEYIDCSNPSCNRGG